MKRILTLMLLVCFMAAGLPAAFAAEYIGNNYNPKYEGARAGAPVGKVPADVPENGVLYLMDTSQPGLQGFMDAIRMGRKGE